MMPWLILAALLSWSVGVRAATLEVAPDKRFAHIEAAAAAAKPGDEIRVFPLPGGRAYEGVGALVDKPRLTITTCTTPS